jgi:DNA ligase-1
MLVVTCHLQLEGVRVQVHRAGDEIRVLTRRLDDITSRASEVVEAIRELLLTACFFDLLHLDGED